MFPDMTTQGRHYAHPLISWSAVIAGALVAIACGVVFTLVGVAIGAAAFNPFTLARDGGALSIGGGLWIMFSQLVALQIGAFVAARAAHYPDHFGGTLLGGLVWALAIFVALTFTALGAASGAPGLLQSQPEFAATLAETVEETTDSATGETADTADLLAAEQSADALSTLAWWATGSLGLGLAGAVAGGWLGARHPNWERRPRHDSELATGAARVAKVS
jgi:hypothetical protein